MPSRLATAIALRNGTLIPIVDWSMKFGYCKAAGP